jgi:trigger factor
VTLTIHKEEDEQRQLKVTVNVAEERVQEQISQLIRKLSRDVQIPGFRRGKAPTQVLVRRFGEEALRAEAVEGMLEPLMAEILQEVNADEMAYYPPVLDDMELNPLEIFLTIPLEPVVKLGDYRAIRKEIEPIEITDEALNEAIEHIRGHHQVLETVERPAETGDLVTVSGEGRLVENDEPFWHVHEADILLDPAISFPDLPVVENLIGILTGEEKEFTFTFPETYEEEELAGKEAIMEITVEKVQSRFLPELDDELVQKEGNYETVEELRESLKTELHDQAFTQAKETLMDEMIDEMLQETEILYPPAAVEVEIDKFLQSLKNEVKRSNLEWADFLSSQQQTEESLREQWREGAIRNVRRGLTLRQFVLEEKIKVTAADIDAAMEEKLGKFDDNEELREQLRNIFTQGRSFETMQQSIVEEKIHERMQAIATGNAPDLATLEEEEEAEALDEEE